MYTIKLQVEKEKELYHPFDPDDTLISDSVKDYILDRLKENNAGDEVQIQIQSQDSIDEDHIRKAVLNWTAEEKRSLKAEHRKNTIQQLWMFGVGVLFLAISLALEAKVGLVWYTVLSTIGAFSMWEAASIWIIQNPKLRLQRRIVDRRLAGIRIQVNAPTGEGNDTLV